MGRRFITFLLIMIFPFLWLASAAMATEVGISEPFSGGYTSFKEWEARVGMDRTREMGARWHREWVFWKDWQRTRGAALDPSQRRMLDTIAALANDRGIRVYGMIYAAPPWANGSPVPERIPGDGDPNNPAFRQFVKDYGNFVYQMVSAYRGRIDHWEVWNEPDLDEFWRTAHPSSPEKKAQGYAYLLKQTYLRAKQANPRAVVIMGGPTAWGSDRFVAELYRQGAKPYFDRANIHPYTENPLARPADSPLFARIGSMKRIMNANGDSRKPIWVTEFGYSTTGNVANRTVTGQQKSDYLINAVDTVDSRYPYVEMFSFFRLMDRRWYVSGDMEAGFGLLYTDVYRDGVRTGHYLYEPKPVFYRLKSYLAGRAAVQGLSVQTSDAFRPRFGNEPASASTGFS